MQSQRHRLSCMAPVFLIITITVFIVNPWAALACGDTSTPSEKTCRDCIVSQMTYGCTLCASPVRCMARCLWQGTSRGKCAKRCDCYKGGKPKLSDCRSCLLKCKCDCVT